VVARFLHMIPPLPHCRQSSSLRSHRLIRVLLAKLREDGVAVIALETVPGGADEEVAAHPPAARSYGSNGQWSWFWGSGSGVECRSNFPSPPLRKGFG